jgi:hypothetical protein
MTWDGTAGQSLPSNEERKSFLLIDLYCKLWKYFNHELDLFYTGKK